MKVQATWTVVEQHTAEIEVEDGTMPEDMPDVLTSALLADHEDGGSFEYTLDRSLQDWEPRV